MRLLGILVFNVILCGCGNPNVYSNYSSPIAASATEKPMTIQAPSACSEFVGSKSSLTNLGEIAIALRGGDFKKQEFETTEQFKTRLSSRIKSASQRASLRGDYFYFAIPIPKDQITYDADQGRMTIGQEYSGLLNSEFGSKGELNISSTRRATGSYVGQNSFGVKKEITRIDERKLNVIVPGGEYSSWPSQFKPIVFYPERTEAKATKENLIVLFAARFKQPYFTSETRHFSPKIDAPYDITTLVESIHLDADCAIILDKAHKAKIADLSLASRY